MRDALPTAGLFRTLALSNLPFSSSAVAHLFGEQIGELNSCVTERGALLVLCDGTRGLLRYASFEVGISPEEAA
ncbi:hypothetical protein MXAN_0600 [Myxococcus xanthus DK 1622]|uniref:Uncharacterized protein n=1 Tax=Myxococcus xanthus (strain DK1622) TaxID=246197 RepID=Q1DEQ5_MYXXD|nr:hypothetical protein MXAN_0600 [Myxococcus xanthus DK 1622]NOJ55659.1 DUF2379 family protein [Myxococcus xanthus]QVW69354.1 DUF2379 family protein [Myxococcus xanthus DZ2]QPM80290.1 DUF2379 family protein [Myxococcus xanthus]QZZ48140.1 hypothetical protein MyxoNM_02950 [Myxococcus xanthus]